MSQKTDSRFYKAKEENSLTLIEECLDHIYNVRKRSLAQKKAQATSLMEKRKQDLDPVNSPLMRVRPTIVPFEEDEDDEDHEERSKLASELSAKLKTPATFTTAKRAVAHEPSHRKPASAQALLEEFMEVFKQIIQDAEEDDELEEDCDRLTDRYFTNGLDLLPSSKEVTEAKRKIAELIEDLASGNIAKHKPTERRVQDMDFDIKESSSVMKRPKSVQFKDPSPQTSSSPEQSNKIPASTTNPALDKAQAEKLRIKQQYENYMKMKRRNDQHRDAQKIKEMEEFNNDIKNVLASIGPTSPT